MARSLSRTSALHVEGRAVFGGGSLLNPSDRSVASDQTLVLDSRCRAGVAAVGADPGKTAPGVESGGLDSRGGGIRHGSNTKGSTDSTSRAVRA